MNIKYIVQVIVVYSIFYASASCAGVNFQNGNFYITYTDITLPETKGGMSFTLERTYNSSASFMGIFGRGWGSDLETYLRPMADGSIKVYENGSGSVSVYYPDKKTDSDTYQYAWHSGHIRTNVIRSSDGFHRTNKSTTEIFNIDGDLSRIEDNYGNFLDVKRNQQGRILSVTDNANRQIKFIYRKGSLERVSYNGVETRYKFDRVDLVEVKDSAENMFRYEYDDNSNMTAIRYTDGTSKEMRYENDLRMISWLKDRNGRWSSYRYSDLELPDKDVFKHYSIEVAKGLGDDEYSRVKETFLVRKDSRGHEYNALRKRSNDGSHFEIHKSPCGVIKRIEHGRAATAQYDDDCRMIGQQKNGQSWLYSYSGASLKVNTVNMTKNGRLKHSLTYNYDANDELVRAEDLLKKEFVVISYGLDGKITQLDTRTKGSLFLSYDDNMNVSKVLSSDGYELQIKYDGNNKIVDIDSPQGGGAAARLRNIYTMLMDIIQPLGKSFSL